MLKGAGFITLLLFCFLSGAQTKLNVEKILSVTNAGSWGTAGTLQYCSKGTYAVGFRMMIESYQGSGDDTGMNGIELICQSWTGGDRNRIRSKVGPWGTWRNERFCDNRGGQKQFLTSYKLKVEPWSRDNDDTAANAVTFTCRNFNDTNGSHTINDDGNTHNWGSYGSWSASCGLSSAICGMITIVEDHVGSGDDTALNDVRFLCCKYYP